MIQPLMARSQQVISLFTWDRLQRNPWESPSLPKELSPASFSPGLPEMGKETACPILQIQQIAKE